MLINLVYELGLLRLLRVVVWVSCQMMCIWDAPWRRMAHPRLPGNMVSGYYANPRMVTLMYFSMWRDPFRAVLTRASQNFQDSHQNGQEQLW